VHKRKIKQTDKKYSAWFYFVMFLIPFLILIILETGLRFFNYGKDYTVFVKISDQFENLLFFNPVLPQKYFSSSLPIPSVIPDGFDKIKKENTFRIFVMGGSSAAGFPYPPNASFPRFLKRKLQLVYPENKIEVINLGVSAVNSIFIRDILNDVIDQSPDLIIFYTGHNEYYGAYGAASNDLKGYSPTLTRFTLFLKHYKVYQLILNIIEYVNTSLDNDKIEENNKTLMASMVGDSKVELDSKIYNNGLEQFGENFDFILKECISNKINVLTATLTSNMKQKPLIGISDINHISNKIFLDAETNLTEGNFDKAAMQFSKAIDHDAVMFRAPSAVNEIIKKISLTYNYSIVDIDSVFKSVGENGMPGYDLFVDHLHPNIRGNKIIADEFYNKIKSTADLNKNNNYENRETEIENYLNQEFPFSRFDSTYSQIKIELLLNSYPFKRNSNLSAVLNSFKLYNLSDSLALMAVKGNISWEDAHYKLAEHFYRVNDIPSFYKEMNVLIEDKTFDKYTYTVTAEKLIEKKYYSLSKIVLLKLFHLYPDENSASKLGFLFLEENNFISAIRFYNDAIKFNPKKPEYYFYLSKAYFKNNELQKAVSAIEYCLKLSPNNQTARKIYESLKTSSFKNK